MWGPTLPGERQGNGSSPLGWKFAPRSRLGSWSYVARSACLLACEFVRAHVLGDSGGMHASQGASCVAYARLCPSRASPCTPMQVHQARLRRAEDGLTLRKGGYGGNLATGLHRIVDLVDHFAPLAIFGGTCQGQAVHQSVWHGMRML